MSTPVLVVGSVALDSIETPVAQRDEVLGGAASYFSVVASLLAPVRLVAVVGEDFPEAHLQFLRERGVDLTGLERVAGRTFRWRGRYLRNMVDRETLDTQLNVFAQFSPSLPEAYRDSRVVFLANIDPRLQLSVLSQVATPQMVACDTMNFWLTGESLATFRQVLARTQLAFFNDEEARMLAGEDNLVAAAAAIQALGVPYIVIKRGDAGAMLFAEGQVFWAPAFPLRGVVDPTGAGDCFAGGMVGYLAARQEMTLPVLKQAMTVGAVTASFAVEGFGVDRLRTLTRAELQSRCAEMAALVSCDPVAV